MSRHRLLIAGGGTGGHVLAGIAIAEEYKKQFPDSEILFVGSRGGLEEKLVKDYPLRLLNLGSLNRVSLGRRVKTLFQLPLSLVVAFFILLWFKPGAVVGVGGYASGPVLLIAGLLRVFARWNTGVLEMNAVPGLTNRWLGKIVAKIFLAFPSKVSGFADGKIVVTGNPIRSQMKPLEPAESNPFQLFIFGGSQGAMGINSLVLAALPHLQNRLKGRVVSILHQTGTKDFERVKQGYQSLHLNASMKTEVKEFVYEMKEAYQRSSLLICRAGASTMAEVAAVGRAAVFIPLPTASDNHQEKNAKIFAQAGAAMIRLQDQCSGQELADLIIHLMDQPHLLREMEKKVSQFYRPHAAREIVTALDYGTG